MDPALPHADFQVTALGALYSVINRTIDPGAWIPGDGGKYVPIV
jgi:hypothetical protein